MRVCTAVITQPTRCRLPGMRSTVTGWCCTAAAVLWCMAPVVHPPRPWGSVTRGVDRWHRHSVFPMREQPGNCPTTTKQPNRPPPNCHHPNMHHIPTCQPGRCGPAVAPHIWETPGHVAGTMAAPNTHTRPHSRVCAPHSHWAGSRQRVNSVGRHCVRQVGANNTAPPAAAKGNAPALHTHVHTHAAACTTPRRGGHMTKRRHRLFHNTVKERPLGTGHQPWAA